MSVLAAPCTVLDRLINACDQFDATCADADARDLRQPDLMDLQDQLWGFTANICTLIEQLGRTRTRPELLHNFRTEHFHPKVIRWYRRNPHFDRLWTKPAGYSGDYATVELLCQGHSRFLHFHDVFLNHMIECGMARQHRGKVVQHASFILRALTTTPRGRRTRMLNVGCGPSFDVRLALGQVHEKIDAEILLADLDPQALAFSRKHLSTQDRVQIRYQEIDVVALIRNLSAARPAVEFDAILFGGLFDYVPDDAIAFILRRATKLLAPGGSILFSQVSTANPDRTAMEWFCDWRLLERDEDDVRRLIAKAEIPDERATLWRDQTRMTILCELTA